MLSIKPDIAIIESLITPILIALKDRREHRLDDIRKIVGKELPEEKKTQISWTLTFLKQTGFIDDPEPGQGSHRITKKGADLIKSVQQKIDLEILYYKYPELYHKDISSKLKGEIAEAHPEFFVSNMGVVIREKRGFKTAAKEDLSIYGINANRNLVTEQLDHIEETLDFKLHDTCLYFLLGEETRRTRRTVYIGQTENIRERFRSHDRGENRRNWWKDTIIITCEKFNGTDVRYMEKQLIAQAPDYFGWKLDNHSSPGNISDSPPNISNLEKVIIPTVRRILSALI